jgi:hypothetical protein
MKTGCYGMELEIKKVEQILSALQTDGSPDQQN